MEIYICYFLIYFIEALILKQYTSVLFYPKFSKKAEYSALFICYGLLFLISFQKNFLINILSFFLINFLFIAKSYQTTWFSAFFHASVITTIMTATELIIVSFIFTYAHDFYAEQTYFRNLSLLAVLSKTIYFLVIYLIAHALKRKEDKNHQQDKISLFLTGIPILSSYIILTLMKICQDTHLSLTLDWMISVAAFLLLAVNLLIFALNHFVQKKNQEFTKMMLQLQREYDTTEYYKMMLQQHENQSILIHDIKKHLQSIALLNEQQEQQKIAVYIEHILQSSDFKKTLQKCDCELLNAILYRYNRQCSDKQIAFHTDIRSHTVDFLEDSELTSLFCNLLDNAFEAASQVPESFIELNISKREHTPFTVLTMTNSCRTNPFNQRSGELISTKPDKLHHGFGMKSIKQIVERHHGEMQTYYDSENITFHTIITMKHILPSGQNSKKSADYPL